MDADGSLAASAAHVLVFTKYPEAGYAKTRLIPAVGAEGAAAISRALSERTLTTVRAACADIPALPVVHYAARAGAANDTAVRAWLRPHVGPHAHLAPQVSGSLGDRLRAAFRASLLGVPPADRKVVVVGVDSPELTVDLLRQAFRALGTSDIVVGPAVDGGYYLLGMRGLHLGVFDDVRWSTETVYAETVRNCERLGLTHASLPALRDIDLPEDIAYFHEMHIS